MKINDTKFGFKLCEIRPSTELSLTMYRFVYEKNGCELIWFKRDDKNKTFTITFKTLPEDSSGVFHILEHSVLCGSDKYPVKEPFVELLKGSMKTFLNAFTFPDKTMYPASSKNPKDFQNLISVYLDAVLHPLALSKKEIFYQEGWHYEIKDKSAPLEYKGVVFNEMKGAYSSADDVSFEYIKKQLFPDNCYRHDSGGDPEVIKTLTFENFKAAHAKYYHPSNAKIILDGDLDIYETLENISSFIGEYDMQKIQSDIPMQRPCGKTVGEYEYEIGDNEELKDKGRISIATVSSNYLENDKTVALNILADALAGNNEAQFKKAALEMGLCEEINMFTVDGLQQNMFIIEAKNIPDDKIDTVENSVRNILKDIVKKGIDKKALVASFNSFEFKQRERDFGSYPTGIIFAMSALETWLYGGDPLKNLEYDNTFKSLREKIDLGYFEQIINDVILNEGHMATVYLKPSKTLGKKRSEDEKESLAKIKADMSEETLNAQIELNSKLDLWQSSEDTPEALATLPALTLEDITVDIEKVPTDLTDKDGCMLISHDINTNGIIYPKLHLDVSDFDTDELKILGAYVLLFKQLGTTLSTPSELQTKIKSELGALGAAFTCYHNAKTNDIRPYLVISVSALENKKQSVVQILDDIINATDFDNDEIIKKNFKQFVLGYEEGISAQGHSIAMQRATAYVSRIAAIGEAVMGNDCYFFIKDILKNYDEKADEFKTKLKALNKKLFSKDRLSVSYTGKSDIEFLSKLKDVVKGEAKKGKPYNHKPLGALNEAIVVPTRVAYASIAENAYDFGGKIDGTSLVARAILNYAYLWSEIRVKGGAYGAGMGLKRNGHIAFYSYRDPNPAASIDVYRKSGEFLESFVKSKQNFANFVIGTISDVDTLYTPRSAGAAETTNYFSDYTYDDMLKFLCEIKETTYEDILKTAKLLDSSLENAPVCVVCNREQLEPLGDNIKNVIVI